MQRPRVVVHWRPGVAAVPPPRQDGDVGGGPRAAGRSLLVVHRRQPRLSAGSRPRLDFSHRRSASNNRINLYIFSYENVLPS